MVLMLRFFTAGNDQSQLISECSRVVTSLVEKREHFQQKPSITGMQEPGA